MPAAAFNFDDPDHPTAAPFTAPGLDETLSNFGEEVIIAVSKWDSEECYTQWGERDNVPGCFDVPPFATSKKPRAYNGMSHVRGRLHGATCTYTSIQVDARTACIPIYSSDACAFS